MKPIVIDLETSLGGKIFGPDSRDPSNDYYTLIYGDHPDRVTIEHRAEGYGRTLPNNIFADCDLIVGHNLGFDLSYLWETPELITYLDNGGAVWDTALAEYLMSGQRHKYPSLKELQKLYLDQQIKEDRISYLFSKGVGAERIIAARKRCPMLFALYEKYCKGDGVSTLRVFAAQYRKAKEMGMLPILKAWMRGFLGLLEMENSGLQVNLDNCEQTLQSFRQQALENLAKATELVRDKWDERLGEFNINSPKHKSAMLFGGEFKIKEKVQDGFFKNGNPKFKAVDAFITIEGFGLPLSWTKGSKREGLYVTDDGVINEIGKRCTDATVLEYCRLQKEAMRFTKMASTYLEPFIKYSVDGVLKPRYNKTLTVTGRLSSSQPNMQNCCSADTEVLTRSGWKLFPELLDGEEVYQVDPITAEGKFVVPSRVVRLYQDSSLISVKSEWGEFLYTAGHRIISYGRDMKLPHIESAADWLNFKGKIIDRKVLRSSVKTGGRVLTDAERFELELAIIVQAEGYLDTKRKVPCYNLRFEGSRKIAQIKQLISDIKPAANGGVRFNLDMTATGPWLDGSKAKNFTTKILELSCDDLRWFITTLHKWDGDFTRGKTYGQKMSKREKSLDIVQAVACLVGQSTSWYCHPHKDFSVVNFHKNMYRYQSRTEVKEVEYKGMVYCVTVPTGAFIIRRNKQVVVTGNCPASGDMLVPIQGQLIAPHGYIAADIDFCLAPFTKILTEEFIWKEIKDIEVGEALVGFEENVRSHDGRKFQQSLVTHKKILRKECLKITTSEGVIICSKDHMFLAFHYGRNRDLSWVKAEDLTGRHTLSKVCEVWDTPQTNETGWGGGFLDGEGYISNESQIGFGQNADGDNALCFNKMIRLFDEYLVNVENRYDTKRRCVKVRPAGLRTGWQSVGVFQPDRLKAKLKRSYINRSTRSKRNRKVFIFQIEDIGTQEVVALQTSTKTFLAEGLMSHNCQLEPFVTAMLSEDQSLINDLTTGVCLHCRAVSWVPSMSEGKTYEEIYQLAVVDKDPKWVLKRKKAKAINFKRAYGGGAQSLAEKEGLPIEDVQAVFDSQDIVYSRVKEFNDELFESLRLKQKPSLRRDFSRIDQKRRRFEHGLELLPIYTMDGQLTYQSGEYRHYGTYKTRFGRKFTFEEIGKRSRHGQLFRRYSTTETRNYQIQGTAGDVVMLACAEVFAYVRANKDDIRLVRQIHDSLGFYIKEDTISLHIPKLCGIMSDVKMLYKKYLNIEIPFNFNVEAKIGKDFATMEVFEFDKRESID